MTKRLYKSRTDKVIGGVCGGLGVYLEMDPVVIRLVYLLVTVFTAIGPGIICYIIAMLVIPEEPTITPSKPVEAETPPAGA